MSKHIINAGATSQRFYIYLQDSTTGQAETGVTSATCYYLRDAVTGTMPAAITLTFGASFATPGTYPAWSSGQVREIGYMPGIYLIDIPDAVFANTVRNAVVQIVPTTGTPWLPVNLEFTLSAINIYNSSNAGITNLDAAITSRMATYTQPAGFLAATFPGGTIANTTNITAGTIATVSGNVNGNVAGSVGSVTGNVSGNVTGSVGTLTAAAVQNIWDDATANNTVVGSVGKLIVDNLNATVSSRSTLTAANVWDALETSITTVSSIGLKLKTNIDAAITSRMASYTQPSGFLSTTFPTGTVASTTNITGGTITTVSGNVNGSVASVTGNVNGSVASVTGNVGGSVGSVVGNVGGNVVGSVNSVATPVTVGTINNDVITAASIATDAIDSDAIANSAITIRLSTDGTPSEGRLIAGTTAADVWNASLASYNAGSSFGQRILRSSNAQSECDVTASGHISAEVYGLQNDVITASSIATDAIDADSLAINAVTEIADGILARDLGSGTNAGVLNERTVRSALRAIRNRTSITGTALTVTNETDNLTTGVAWTATLATNPLADPVTGIDPA
jgi:hypothetical protein